MKNLLFSCVLTLALLALAGTGFMPAPGHAESSGEHGKADSHASANSEPAEEGEGEEPEALVREESRPKREEGKGDEDYYVHLQPMVLPVVSGSGAEQIVTLLIDLRVENVDDMRLVHAKIPRVRDSILETLYGGLGDGSLRQGNVVNIPGMKTKIVQVLEKVFGRPLVKEVLIQGVAQRML